MFGFLRRKKPPEPTPAATPAPAAPAATEAVPSPVAGVPPVLPEVAIDAPVVAAPGAGLLPAELPASPPMAPAIVLPTLSPAESIVRETPTSAADAAVMSGATATVPAIVPAIVPATASATATAAVPAEATALATTRGDDAPAPAPARAGWMARLKQGLTKTRGNLAGLFRTVKVDEALFEDLETALLMSDAGFDATQRLLTRLRARVKERKLSEGEQVRAALKELIAEDLAVLERPIDIDEGAPLVLMIAGVNGAGKTTSIGKLAHHLRREGKTILLAAGDTFRAAAREQLITWGERNGVQVISQQGGDPAAVAFDAVSAGIARRTGVVMVDTAGRLPTQAHLMDELRKIKRVIGKALPGAPHQTLLILDGNTGQNMLAQVKAFDDSVSLSGLIVTKLDGTAKGGALVGLAHLRRERPIPVYFIGVGEGLEDLQAFSAHEFADALVG